jgi:hypothetical protein
MGEWNPDSCRKSAEALAEIPLKREWINGTLIIIKVTREKNHFQFRKPDAERHL